MKNAFYLFLALIICKNGFSQEMVSSVTVGTKFDLVYEPITVQAEYSRSQTLYYPDQMGFRGTITSIKYFTEFSSSSFTNSVTWRVKMGLTNKAEFTPGDSYISDSELTEVFNGKISYSGYAVTLTFNKPFYYDGKQNLVIDVEELDPGKTTSNLTTFTGVEDFGNPPKRTRMTMSNETVIYENSYACTEFGGNLERCPIVYQGAFANITATSAVASWSNPSNFPWRYNVNIVDQPIPSTYQVVNGGSVQLDNLQPATIYYFNRKADCDISPTNWGRQSFTTSPSAITVPTNISFDGAKTFNYLLTPGYSGGNSLSPNAALNSENGILFQGYSDSKVLSWWTSTGDPWIENSGFISRATFSIDLTNYTGNPVFQFDLRQTKDSKFRISGAFLSPFVYSSTTPNSDDFKTITIDLSKKVGTKFNLIMQHLGRYTTATSPYNTAFVDNVKLIEAVCLPPKDVVFTKSENTITLAWTSNADEWEVIWNNHDLTPANSGVVTKNNLFTITELLPAKSYDIFIRSKCGNSYSAWKKMIISTKPTTVQVPYQEAFSTPTTNYAPELQDSSRQILSSSKLIGYQKNYGYDWVGGSVTTEQQAWNDNKSFTSGATFSVDAKNLISLNMAVRLKQQYYYSQKTSWFRVLVNGTQLGASRNPSTISSDPYQTINYDLTPFAGKVIEVTLQHCGRYTEDFVENLHADITRLDNVEFSGQALGTEDFLQEAGVLIFPNPSEGEINFVHNSDNIDEITVSDLSGKILMTHKPKEAMKEITLNISSLTTGTYFAKIKSNGKYQHAKIVRK